MTRSCVAPLTPSSCMPFRNSVTRTRARSTPRIEPDPPKMSTPPRTTAVTTSMSSEPAAASACTAPKNPRYTMPANPAISRRATKTVTRTRVTGMPEKRAASRLDPIAYT